MRRMRGWIVRLGVGISATCILLWVLSQITGHFDKSWKSLPEFLVGDRWVGLRSGYLYLNFSRRTSDAERDLVRQMDDWHARLNRNEPVPPPLTLSSATTKSGSGDKWLIFGWHKEWTLRQAGPYAGTIGCRVGAWVSLAGVALLGLVPWAASGVARARRRFIIRRRQLAGLCPVCAYDLRATEERCPECGTPKT